MTERNVENLYNQHKERVKTVDIINVREKPEYVEIAIEYWHNIWGGGSNNPEKRFYFKEAIERSIKTKSGLPTYYLMTENDKIIGCVGLITSDFMACCDLWPWLCGLYVDENYRGKSLGSLLIDRVKKDSAKYGFDNLYLCTDHIGYYEKYGFDYLFDSYAFWGERGRVYGFIQNS